MKQIEKNQDPIKYKNQFLLLLYVLNANVGGFMFGYFVACFNPLQIFFFYNFNLDTQNSSWLSETFLTSS